MGHTLIIAEAGVNHNGDMNIARLLIDAAVDAGADIVKFQTFKADKLVSEKAQKASYQLRNSGDDDSSQFNMLRKLELNVEQHRELMDYCSRKKIRFLSTAFDLDSIDLLCDLGIDLFKIPSGEITNLPYLEKIGGLGREVILSTGMSEMNDIEDALKILEVSGTPRKQVTVLHCNTEYPTPLEDVNLRAMRTIGEAFGVKYGYSDHTTTISVPVAAVALGAVCIEKHFTLDKKQKGPDHLASLGPDELKLMVQMIRETEKSLGSPTKSISDSEKKNINIARKSIHLSHDVEKGRVIQEGDLIMKRPGDGISPMRMREVIGKVASRNLSAGDMLNFTDFSE